MNLLESEVPPDVLRDILDRASARRVFYAWRYRLSGRLCEDCVKERSTSKARVLAGHDTSWMEPPIHPRHFGDVVEVEY